MKIGFISDLHANFEALRALEARLKGLDAIVCLGDLLGYYCQVNETMDWVRQNVTHCVLGNHDHFILNQCPPDVPPAVRFGIEYAGARTDREHLAWLRTLPLVSAYSFAGMSCLLAHGSPWDPLGDYLYPDSPKLPRLDEFKFDLVAFGQTHRYLQIQAKGKLHLNPGSVGQSRDVEFHGQASAVIVDTATRTCTRLLSPYDVGPVIRLAKAHGAGPWIEKHLVS